MNRIKFISFHAIRYRSLLDVKIDMNYTVPVIICGENNIGKTNFLRALNVFFNHLIQDETYDAKYDMPHHIYGGSRGGRTKTELIGVFSEGDRIFSLKVTFGYDNSVTYTVDAEKVTAEQAKEILKKFQFLYIESNNIDLPTLISIVMEKDGLLPLDSKRSKQSKPLKILEKFIDESQKAILDIEKEINQFFQKLTDFDGVLKNKQIAIKFAEFSKLRDVVKQMTSITLSDGNNHSIASKGSGAQRAVFLSLMQSIADNSKRNIIWGIDEPEVFLQPRLQKKVSEVLQGIVSQKSQPVIVTTHSPNFVKLENLGSTYLFQGKSTPKTYSRRPNQTFYEINTEPVKCNSDFEKAMLIKEHLGISNNDGWLVLPLNLLVEGEEDKKYLEIFLDSLGVKSPNIIWSGGASKMSGYLQFHNESAKDLNYKPIFRCILDNDLAGREQFNKIRPDTYKNIIVNKLFIPRYDNLISDGSTPNISWEIEDFIPPRLILDIINIIAKKENYNTITKEQFDARASPANKNTLILEYAEECLRSSNPTKPPLELNNSGRKKLICQQLYQHPLKSKISTLLSKEQSSFLKSLGAS